MPSYWTDHHASSFGTADRPLHAGITRLFLQENALCAYQNSWCNLDAYMPTETAISEACHADNKWSEFENFKALMLPVYLGTSGTARSWNITVTAGMSANTGTLRALLIPHAAEAYVDATTGLPFTSGLTDYDYDDFNLIASYATDTLVVTPQGIDLVGGGDSGLTFPCCFLVFAVRQTVGSGATAAIKNIRYALGT